jgi:pyruvate/2-oxoglutarate/acetoin dehydrogenase E1 component
MRESGARNITYSQAIREGLDQTMALDSRVIVIGEGVPDPKAIFNTTSDLREKYGTRRVFDMPLSENGMTGICIGAALSGLRPVMVHQRIDFALLAMDQLVNNAAKWHYMFNGKATVPLVVRVIVGRGWGQGPQHSQSLQALFAQIPGLKVVMPTTAHDAKGMLISAIEDDNPVIFIEHRWLHHVSDVVPEEIYRVPLDQARTLQQGNDVTVAAFSYMVVEALLAARALAPHCHLDVIDMRCVRPLDVETVAKSVRKTGRLIVADTASRIGGVAAELISQVIELEYKSLKAAPIRIASPDYPTPTSHFMANGYYPDAIAIADAALELIGSQSTLINYPMLVETLRRSERLDIPIKSFRGPF